MVYPLYYTISFIFSVNGVICLSYYTIYTIESLDAIPSTTSASVGSPPLRVSSYPLESKLADISYIGCQYLLDQARAVSSATSA